MRFLYIYDTQQKDKITFEIFFSFDFLYIQTFILLMIII